MTTNTYLTAPIWRRLAALVYDSFILLALSFIYGVIITTIASLLGDHASDYQPMFTGIKGLIFFGGLFLTIIGFYCYFWHRSGQTIGMRTWHIKVVRCNDEERTPSWRQCFIRALTATPAVLVLGLGYFYALFRSARRTPQDLISDTKIILLR